MATQAELMQAALDAMKAAQWDPHKWCEAIQNGYPPGHEYAYAGTPNYKAQNLMWLAAHPVAPPPPPPPPPPPHDLTWAMGWVLIAEYPEVALEYDPRYGIAWTADPGYDKPPASLVAAVKKRQHDAGARERTRSWCDCRVPDGDPPGTPPAVAIKMASDLGLNGWIGQGESSAEYQRFLDAGGDLAVVDLGKLTAAQKRTISPGPKVVVVENYRNCGAGSPDWQNLNAGIAGNCVAVYKEGPCPGMAFQTYLDNGWFVRLRDWIYDPQMTENDRKAA